MQAGHPFDDAMITTPEELATLVERALHAKCVAIDTEFVWERTYYPKLGLVQIGLSEDDCVLVDAVACDDLTPLGALLATPDVVKILHDAQLDLTILRRVTGTAPRNIFDTRRAAGFVGLGATISLGALLHELLGVQLAKTEARTDWLRRPLSPEQRAYALDDVRYMLAARTELLARVRRRHREAWLREELATYDIPLRYEEADARTQYRRLAGTGKLTARQRAVLREVTAWREEEARRQDRPRGHIVHDKVLSSLARRPPRSQQALRANGKLSENALQCYGDALLDAVQRGLATPREQCPPPPKHRPHDETLQARINFVLAYLVGTCLHDGIDPALVAPRAEVTDLVTAGPQADPDRHPLLQGWRRAFLGDELLQLLAGKHAVRLDPETGLPRLRP